MMREQPEVITSLLINHSANLFFVIRPLACDAGLVRLGFVLRSEFAKACHLTSALGCALDCLACVAGHQTLGQCTVAESEASFHLDCLPFAAGQLSHPPEFIAEARLDQIDNNLALFSSCIYACGDQSNLPLVNACGTLTRLRAHKQHTNNLVVMADWRRLQGACAH